MQLHQRVREDHRAQRCDAGAFQPLPVEPQRQLGFGFDRRRSIEHQRTDPAGMRQRKMQRQPCPLRHADQRCLLHPRRVHHRAQVIHVAVDVGHALRQPEATAVESQHGEVRREPWREQIPAGEVQRPAVQQHHAGSAAFRAPVQPRACMLKVMIPAHRGDYRGRTTDYTCALSDSTGTLASSAEIALAMRSSVGSRWPTSEAPLVWREWLEEFSAATTRPLAS